MLLLSLRVFIATTLAKILAGTSVGEVRTTSLNFHFEHITMANCRKQTCWKIIQVIGKTDFYRVCGNWYNKIWSRVIFLLSFEDFIHAYNVFLLFYHHTPHSFFELFLTIPYLSTPSSNFFFNTPVRTVCVAICEWVWGIQCSMVNLLGITPLRKLTTPIQ